ncbi:hypothetical protein Hanom_Chr00s000004g01607361 [Helianthus anomalus]
MRGSGGVVEKIVGVPCDSGWTPTFPIIFFGIQVKANTDDVGSSWMRGDVLPIISLSCLRTGGGRVSTHLGEPRGWRRSSSRRWPQRPVSQWSTHCSLPLNKI